MSMSFALNHFNNQTYTIQYLKNYRMSYHTAFPSMTYCRSDMPYWHT